MWLLVYFLCLVFCCVTHDEKIVFFIDIIDNRVSRTEYYYDIIMFNWVTNKNGEKVVTIKQKAEEEEIK